MQRRILIVSASFCPKISPRSFRTTELAKELSRMGHDVHVCIPESDYDYSEFIRNNPMTIRNFGHLNFKPIVLKGSRIEMLIRRLFRRVLSILIEYPTIEIMFKLARFLKHESGYDLLISVAVPFPVHWGVSKARTKRHPIANIWVADCGDPYMGNVADSFRKLFYFKYVEKWFSRKCDYISIPFDALRDKFYEEFHNKIVVIPQGFRVMDIKHAEQKKNNIPTFAFAGSIIPGIRDLDLFLKFLIEIDIRFKFHVYTNQHEYYSQYIKHLSGKLEVQNYLPRLQLIYELSKCDFLINVDTIYDCKSITTAFPSKLIDYSFTGKPILNICSNSIDKTKILEFLSGNYKNRRIVNSEDYRIENVASKFLNLVHKGENEE
ncbi:MAG: glycosyltransferase [Bacteroidales bacterium]|nr:glycosyltransferase [Bacteroidales bacterium]